MNRMVGSLDGAEQANKTWLILDEAAWVADSGRWMDAIETGKLNEVEPVTSIVRLNTDAFVDVYCWHHPLPRKQI